MAVIPDGHADRIRFDVASIGPVRRNTRRAIRRFFSMLAPEEPVLDLVAGTYWLQTGYLAVTDRRVVIGMSWPLLPFTDRRLSIPHRWITAVRFKWLPWGAVVNVSGPVRGAGIGGLELARAEAVVRLLAEQVELAKAG